MSSLQQVYRARYKLLPYSLEIHDGSKSIQESGRTNNGWCRPGWTSAIYHLFWYFPLIRGYLSPIQRRFCFNINWMQSGKPQFGYIYGVGLLGSASIYTLLNLMSEKGIDAYRVASVLGYCLLPMVGVGALSVMVTLECVLDILPFDTSFDRFFSQISGTLGYLLSTLSIIWCTYAASGIFVVVLRMSDQRLLVAYPIGLLYGCFALLSVFNAGVNWGERLLVSSFIFCRFYIIPLHYGYLEKKNCFANIIFILGHFFQV